MMNCSKTSRLVSAYLDGELSGMEMMAIREHLRVCPDCEAEVEQMRMVKLALTRVEPVRAGSLFEARILSALDDVDIPTSVRVKQWFSSRFGIRLEPARVAFFGCAGLMLVALGHLPQSANWNKNYQPAPQPVAMTIPAAPDFGTVSYEGVYHDMSVGKTARPELSLVNSPANTNMLPVQPVATYANLAVYTGR